MGRQLLVLSPLSRREKCARLRRQGSGEILDGTVEQVGIARLRNAAPKPLPAWIYTSAARNTPCCTCFTRDSGTRSVRSRLRLDAGTVFQARQSRADSRRGRTEDVQVARQRGESRRHAGGIRRGCFRLYEMFMGPLEMVKPWNTKGVEGVYRFLGRVWRLFVDEKSETEFEQAETTTGKSCHRGTQWTFERRAGSRRIP